MEGSQNIMGTEKTRLTAGFNLGGNYKCEESGLILKYLTWANGQVGSDF